MYATSAPISRIVPSPSHLGAFGDAWVKHGWHRLWWHARTSEPWQFGGWLWGTWRAGLQSYADCRYVRTVDASGTGLPTCKTDGSRTDLLTTGTSVSGLVNPRYRPLHVWEGPKHGWYFDGWLWTDDQKAAALRTLPQFASVAHLGN